MTVVELWPEYRRALADPRTEDALTKHDVTDPVATSICGLATVETSGKFYEPHTLGRLMVVCPVFDDDELCDLIAFDPSIPDKWYFRLGELPLLGSYALSGQLLGSLLHVYRTPLRWLQEGCDGVVLFDLNRTFDDIVGAPYGLAGEDDAHTDELRRMMTETALCRLPRFFVREGKAE